MSYALSGLWWGLGRATWKAMMSRFRGLGWTPQHPRWTERAEICERCPLRVIQCNRSYCGKPYLQQAQRDPVIDGCGCPCREKAKDPSEHCPLTIAHQASEQRSNECNCKWCHLLNSNQG